MTRMANPDQLAVLGKGTDTWNAWRKASGGWIDIDLREANLQNTNLSGMELKRVDFSGAQLSGANLKRANLRHSNFTSAHLDDADLTGADLRNANLTLAELKGAELSRADLSAADLNGADLSGAQMRNTFLTGANLRNANLSGANLIRVDVIGADLGNAILNETVFGGLDLTLTRGLESVHHLGPSMIDANTIFRSRKNISEVFLRGVGIADFFINYVKSLVGSAIEFYSCFISYSIKDQQFADRLYADLQAKGVRCWFAPHDVQGGRKIHEQIEEAIRLHDKLLLILSDASMNSNWVKTEIANARDREEKQKRQMLFPITIVPYERVKTWKCFDADRGIDSGREIREYFIPDFSNWKDHDAYQKALDKLVKDLKAPSEKTSKASSAE